MTPDDEDEDDDDGRHDASTMHRRVCSHLAGVSSRVYGSDQRAKTRRETRDAHGVTAALPRHGAARVVSCAQLLTAPVSLLRGCRLYTFTRCAPLRMLGF